MTQTHRKGVISIKEKQKTLNAKIEANDEGKFKGYLSTYTTDRENDIFVKGCWDDYIKEMQRVKGVARVPLLYQHKAPEIIGYADLTTDEKGLIAEGTLYIDDNAKAKTIYRALKDKSLNEMSVGFGVDEYEYYEDENGKIGYRFFKSRVTEASIVYNPANAEAVITQVKNLKELTATDITSVVNSPEFEAKVIDILVAKGLLNEAPTTNDEPFTIENDKNSEQLELRKRLERITEKIKEKQ